MIGYHGFPAIPRNYWEKLKVKKLWNFDKLFVAAKKRFLSNKSEELDIITQDVLDQTTSAFSKYFLGVFFHKF